MIVGAITAVPLILNYQPRPRLDALWRRFIGGSPSISRLTDYDPRSPAQRLGRPDWRLLAG
jgi:hypothetical protein